MKRLLSGWSTAGLLAVACGLALGDVSAQETWLAHDLNRPRPPILAPPPAQLPVPAPADAVVLFDGGDLSRWRSADGGPAKWIVAEGVMQSVPNSGYLHTAEAFGDVQLHLEWAAPVPAQGRSQGRGNSGVFLMGKYEVQVLDSFDNETYADGQCGAVYGQYPPLVNACRAPGEWQSYDIVFRRPRFAADGQLVGPARLTVIHNGLVVQDGVELFGPTAWLQHLPYSPHAERLPLALQDHGNPVRFRNIWLRELPDLGPTHLAEAAEAPYPASPEELARLTGDYGSPLGKLGQIVLEAGQLRLKMETGQVIDLVPRSANEVALLHTAARLVFNLPESGPAQGFLMHLAGDRYPIQRRGE